MRSAPPIGQKPFLISSEVTEGSFASIAPTAPATNAAEADVPSRVSNPPPIFELRIPTPGAETAIFEPKLLNGAFEPSFPTAPTAIASAHQAGTTFETSEFELPAAATTTVPAALAAETAWHTGSVAGSPYPPRLTFSTLTPLEAAYEMASAKAYVVPMPSASSTLSGTILALESTP